MKKTPHFRTYLLATLLLLTAAGQGALAETKTVTYTITSAVHNSTTNTYDIVFTRSGAAFNTSAPTNFSTSVSSSSIGQSGNSGSFLVSLADGFKINVSWESGSNVGFDNNYYISPGANGKQITYNVSCTDETYYVTHVEMRDSKGAWIDQGYDNQWRFSQNYASAYAFGKIIITYGNTPPFSVFQSAGTNTYKIRNKEELRHLANYVNGGNNCDGLTFLQTQDITYDGTENNYAPIGYKKNDFDYSFFFGTYNGQGNTVSGINVSRTGSSDADGYIGLFGNVGAGGIVQNVILDNCSFAGYTNVGGIVGRLANGTVQNCQVTNSVNITNGASNATHFGGIVGEVAFENANVIGCISAANVTSDMADRSIFFGGIAGNLSAGTIKDCLYTGTSIDCWNDEGAILGGMSSGTLSNNYYFYSTANIHGVNGSDADGARRACTVTLGENVTLVGEETAYSVSGLTTIGTTALRYDNTIYSGKGQTLTFSGTPATGYEFSGISVTGIIGGSGGTVSGNTLTMPASNVTVNATFSPIVYTITYHTDGGSLSTTYNTYTIESPNLKLATPTKEGMVFVGWYDNESLTGEPVTTIPTGSTGNKEFWAKFRKDFTQCTATVPDQTLSAYSSTYDCTMSWDGIMYKFEAANDSSNGITVGEVVKDGETTLTLGTDYRFGDVVILTGDGTQTGNQCRVAIIGQGDYAGTKWANFSIIGASASGTWGDLSWSLANGTLTISGTGAMDIAASNAGYPWYQYASYIDFIEIGEGVTSIASWAFGGTQNENPYAGVESVSFPDTITSIGDYAFAYCTSLDIDLVSILEKVNAQDIGTGAFNQIKLLRGTLSVMSDNTAIIGLLSQAAKANVRIHNLTLNKNEWYTMCLPFSISNHNDFFVDLMEIDMENTYEGHKTGLHDGTYYLYFKPVTEEITAGKPFLGRWSGRTDTEHDIRFDGVKVYGDRTDAVSSDGKVKFMGSYAKINSCNSQCTFAISSHDSDSNPEFSSKAMINAFGAYIQLTDASISGLDSNVHDVNDVNAKCFTLTGTIGPATKTLTGTASDGFYWTTFYDGTARYTLPEGATAYTMDANHHLYRLGTDGSVIKENTAGVIISDKESITLTRTADTSEITINGGGNILRGSDYGDLISNLSGTPYVMSIVNGVLGFREYAPTNSHKVPAYKAYYVE